MADAAVIHSVLSFSSRARWSACPASVALSKGLKDRSGAAADEGSLAHKVKERAMLAKTDWDVAHVTADDIDPPAGLDLKDKTSYQWRRELVKHAHDYVAFVRSLVADYPDALILEEQKVAASSIHPALFGTADTIVWIPSVGLLIIIDYKYGFRAVDIGTYEETNSQLAAYGVSAAEMIEATGQKVKGITLAVYQPRVPLRDPAQVLMIENAQSWLLLERVKLAQETAATEAPNAPLVPGDHCRYCKAAMNGVCPTVKQYASTALNVAAGAVALLDIPTDELLALYSARSAFKPFLEEVEERVSQLAKVGHARLQMSEVKGRQMWADPKSAAMTLLAIGRTDLVQPVALSDALPALPAELHDSLVKRSASSSRIKVVDAPHVKDVAQMFSKYVKD